MQIIFPCFPHGWFIYQVELFCWEGHQMLLWRFFTMTSFAMAMFMLLFFYKDDVVRWQFLNWWFLQWHLFTVTIFILICFQWCFLEWHFVYNQNTREALSFLLYVFVFFLAIWKHFTAVFVFPISFTNQIRVFTVWIEHPSMPLEAQPQEQRRVFKQIFVPAWTYIFCHNFHTFASLSTSSSAKTTNVPICPEHSNNVETQFNNFV